MKFQTLDDVSLGGEVRALLGELAEELRRFRELGEFSPEVSEEISRTFLPERISDTLNIEGVRVNPRMTRAILEGLTLSETDRYNEKEVLNVIDANEFMEGMAKDKHAISKELIRELHKRVMKNLIPTAGAFRGHDVQITGASFTPPQFADVPALIEQLCSVYEASVREFPQEHAIVGAVWFHASFAAIHPFIDGNGRVGRLLQDYVLIRHGLLPVGIPAARRQEYYDALAAADGGEWTQLIEIVVDSELTALDRARRIAEAPAQRRSRVRSLLNMAQAATRQRDYNRYEVWRRRIDGIRDEFNRWGVEFNDEAAHFEVRTKVFDPISFDKWSNMREHGWTPGTWVFSQAFFVERQQVFSTIFFARRHEYRFALGYEETLRNAIGLFLTGNEGDGRPDFHEYKDPYIRLRELIYNDTQELLVFRDSNVMAAKETPDQSVNLHLAEPRWRGDDSVGLPDIVEEYFTDVLVKLGLT